MSKQFYAPAIIHSRPKFFPENAILIPGFSASEKLSIGLKEALESGPFKDVKLVTLAQALKHPEDLQEAAESRTVIPHSMGPYAVRRAGAIITLNGAEPTPPLQSVIGALKVAKNFKKIGHEEGLPYVGFLDGAIEVTKNPQTILTVLKLGRFSTLQMLIDGGEEKFPGGRIYSPSKDEYGFGQRHNEEERAREAGIFWAEREGCHDEALLYPTKTAAQLAQFIEEAKQQAA